MFNRLFLLMAMLISLNACTSWPRQKSAEAEKPVEVASVKKWFYAQFRIPQIKDKGPQWEVDAMLAGEIIQPVLEKYRTNIALWRFHRRAGQDKHGHVFSFIFYTDTNSAKRIYQAIEDQATFSLIKKHNIEWLGKRDLEQTNKKTDIAATSDTTWPENLQNSWPPFIMGVSDTWLALVVDLEAQQDSDLSTLKRYANTQKEITMLWQKQAKHAFFHHINAIFAYQPLMMRF